MNNLTQTKAQTRTESLTPSTSDQNNNQDTTSPFPGTTFTYADLYNYLYKNNQIKALNQEDIRKVRRKLATENYWCDVCQKDSTDICTTHGSAHCKLKPPQNNDCNKLSSAISSFPNEVQLCFSSIPGAKYGVIAKCFIPKGTWLGPYEGTRVRVDDVTLGTDARYMWEIFSGGQLAFYVDGSNEETSSWMRFISCARNSTEQNLYAFQYCGNIYYRAFKEITPGTELLVWYDDIYPQFMGIPLEIRETEGIYRRATDHNEKDNKVVVVVTPQANEPSASPLKTPVSSPLVKTGKSSKSRPSSTNSTVIPTIPIVSCSDPRASDRTPPTFTQTKLPSYTRPKSPWQQSKYGTPTPGIDAKAGARPTSELLKRRKRSRTGSSGLPWQHPVTPPAPPRSELLLEKTKIGDVMTGPQWQPGSSSSASPGPHTQADPRIREQEGTSGLQASDPYDLHIQIEPNYGPNLLLNKRSTSDNNTSLGSNSSVAEMREGLEEGISACSEENAFKCGQCGKTFPQRSVLQIHVCPKAPYKPYHCGHCSQLFSDPNELRNHAIIHINEKPFKCGYCSRSFSGATTLNNHIRTHTGEKPFECSTCGKTFSQASQLSRHEKIPGDCARQ